MSDDPFSQHVTLSEAADELGIVTGTARNLARSGKLKAFMFGGRYLVNVDDLAEFKTTYTGQAGHPKKLRGLK